MNEPTNDKNEITNRVANYLKENRAVDLRVFLFEHWANRSQLNSEFISEIANFLRRTNKYEITPENGGLLTTYIVRPAIKKKFNERHPFLFALIICLLGGAFALAGRWVTEIKGNREQNQRDVIQDTRIKQLADSLDAFQRKAVDSIR